MKSLDEFVKKKRYLICVDSDGCAMDTMDVKHIRCFGPCMVKEWGLEEWQDQVLKRWNEINLYSMTRGINRFLALAQALTEVDKNLKKIDGIEKLVQWSETADELSNSSVKAVFEQTGEQIFLKAYDWSVAVNQAIGQLPEELKLPFAGVKEGLAAAHQEADVAIVSSANLDAVLEEWNRHKLMDSVDVCLTQNVGSKASCIGKMLGYCYEKNHVLMIGDAPGDLKAAQKNGVLYYPILVKHEKESWQRFVMEALPKFLEGTYEGAYAEEQIQEFKENLS